MTPQFAVTYEIVTQESAEHGDAAERGFVSRDCRLRDAIGDLFETRTSRVDGIECIEPDTSPDLTAATWLTVINGMEYETGAQESRTLHFPDHLTGPSRARLCRLLGVR